MNFQPPPPGACPPVPNCRQPRLHPPLLLCRLPACLQEVARRYRGLQRSYEGRNVWRAVLSTQQGSKQLVEKLCVFPTAVQVSRAGGVGGGGGGGRVAAQADASQQQVATMPACLLAHQCDPPHPVWLPTHCTGLQAAAAVDMAVVWRERADEEAMEAQQYNFSLKG